MRRTLIEILSGVVYSSRFESVVAFFESDVVLTVHVSLLYLWLISMRFYAYHTPSGVVRWLAIVVLWGVTQRGLCTLGVAHAQ